MKDSYSRLIFVLAGLGVSRGELRQLLLKLRSTSIEEVVNEVSSLALVKKPNREESLDLSYNNYINRVHRDSSVGERVERLLKDEANLSGPAAHRILSDMLAATGLMAPDDIPDLSKKALRVWVDRLISSGVSEKELLRLATLARNRIAHSPQTDWQLGGS